MQLLSLHISLKDCRLFSLSLIIWSFNNSEVWVNFIHCAVTSASSSNVLTHFHWIILQMSSFPYVPCSLSLGLIILILDLLGWSSNFLIFSSIFVFLLFPLESSWICSPTLMSFYFCYYPFSFQELFLNPPNDLPYLYSTLRITLFLKEVFNWLFLL